MIARRNFSVLFFCFLSILILPLVNADAAQYTAQDTACSKAVQHALRAVYPIDIGLCYESPEYEAIVNTVKLNGGVMGKCSSSSFLGLSKKWNDEVIKQTISSICVAATETCRCKVALRIYEEGFDSQRSLRNPQLHYFDLRKGEGLFLTVRKLFDIGYGGKVEPDFTPAIHYYYDTLCEPPMTPSIDPTSDEKIKHSLVSPAGVSQFPDDDLNNLVIGRYPVGGDKGNLGSPHISGFGKVTRVEIIGEPTQCDALDVALGIEPEDVAPGAATTGDGEDDTIGSLPVPEFSFFAASVSIALVGALLFVVKKRMRT